MGGKRTKLSVTTSGRNEAETELKNPYYILPPALLCVWNAHKKIWQWMFPCTKALYFKVTELDDRTYQQQQLRVPALTRNICNIYGNSKPTLVWRSVYFFFIYITTQQWSILPHIQFFYKHCPYWDKSLGREKQVGGRIRKGASLTEFRQSNESRGIATTPSWW